MESALCLHYVPMPSLKAHRIPSMVSTTRPHFTFTHSSLMLSNASATHLKRHAVSPIIKHKAPSVRAFSGDKSAKRPSEHSREDVDKLKMDAMDLLTSGMSKEAEDLLKTPLQEYKDDSEPKYYLSLAVAEIYMFQGKFQEASKCECFKSSYAPPSDARAPLYQAIIFNMLGNKEKARTSWEKYKKIVEENQGLDPSGSGPR